MYDLKLNDINIRDPFVLLHENKYYMYGTRGDTAWGYADGFDVYISEDLIHWSDPIEVFHKPIDFWADQNFWAPEVFYYRGDFYMFASFKSDDSKRGTQILKSNSPLGPFLIHSDKPVTPATWECLDGTLYISRTGTPYMIFCHEWTQIQDGEICMIELSQDLKTAVGKPTKLFAGSEPNWTNKDADHYVTDGPFVYRTTNNTLLMIWSGFDQKGNYVISISRSDNQEINGNWSHDEQLLFDHDGGHGMIFGTHQDTLMITLHSPNTPLEERPHFYKIKEENDTLILDENRK